MASCQYYKKMTLNRTMNEDLLYIILGYLGNKTGKRNFLYLSPISEPVSQTSDSGGSGKENQC